MKTEDTTLEIFIDSRHPERRNDTETLGLRHIAFVVSNLDELVTKLDCTEIRTDWFGRRNTFTKDYDGQPIELIEEQLHEQEN